MDINVKHLIDFLFTCEVIFFIIFIFFKKKGYK